MNTSFDTSLVADRNNVNRRRPAWLPAMAALCLALLTGWLGHWQLDRAHQKRQIESRYETTAQLPVLSLVTAPADWHGLLYHRLRVTGIYDTPFQILIDNRIYREQPGYHVLTPLRLRNGALLVNRGWLPAQSRHSVVPVAQPQRGLQTVEGILVSANSRFLELASDRNQGRVWQNLDLKRYRNWYRPDMADVLLLQTSSAADPSLTVIGHIT
jgi:surfeit locus 1 family protein